MQAPSLLTGSEKMKLWAILFMSFALDQLAKFWASQISGSLDFLGIHFQLVSNSGIVGGILSDFPPLLKTVCISSIGALALAAYIVAQWLIPARAYGLRLGLALCMGGVLGNLWDRVFRGAVVDFIVLPFSSIQNPAFNLGDVFQWLGLILVVIGIARDHRNLWFEKELRHTKSIHPPYQNRFAAFVLFTVSGSILISLIFSLSFLKSALAQFTGLDPHLSDRILFVFVGLFACTQVLYLLAIYWVAHLYSDRSVGPVFAFRRYVESLLSGKNPAPLQLRARDEFQELEETAAQIEKKLKN